MQYSFVILLLASATLIGFASAGNDYLWGECRGTDYQLAKDKVTKAFFVGLEVTTKYVFKQKDNLNALTIRCIKVTDLKSKDGAVAVLTQGGPGSKGATLLFTSVRGHGIKSLVEVFGY